MNMGVGGGGGCDADLLALFQLKSLLARMQIVTARNKFYNFRFSFGKNMALSSE